MSANLNLGSSNPTSRPVSLVPVLPSAFIPAKLKPDARALSDRSSRSHNLLTALELQVALEANPSQCLSSSLLSKTSNLVIRTSAESPHAGAVVDPRTCTKPFACNSDVPDSLLPLIGLRKITLRLNITMGAMIKAGRTPIPVLIHVAALKKASEGTLSNAESCSPAIYSMLFFSDEVAGGGWIISEEQWARQAERCASSSDVSSVELPVSRHAPQSHEHHPLHAKQSSTTALSAKPVPTAPNIAQRPPSVLSTASLSSSTAAAEVLYVGRSGSRSLGLAAGSATLSGAPSALSLHDGNASARLSSSSAFCNAHEAPGSEEPSLAAPLSFDGGGGVPWNVAAPVPRAAAGQRFRAGNGKLIRGAALVSALQANPALTLASYNAGPTISLDRLSGVFLRTTVAAPAPGSVVPAAACSAPFTSVLVPAELIPVVGLVSVQQPWLRAMAAWRRDMGSAAPVEVLVPIATPGGNTLARGVSPSSAPVLRTFVFLPDCRESLLVPASSEVGSGWLVTKHRWSLYLPSGPPVLGSAPAATAPDSTRVASVPRKRNAQRPSEDLTRPTLAAEMVSSGSSASFPFPGASASARRPHFSNASTAASTESTCPVDPLERPNSLGALVRASSALVLTSGLMGVLAPAAAAHGQESGEDVSADLVSAAAGLMDMLVPGKLQGRLALCGSKPFGAVTGDADCLEVDKRPVLGDLSFPWPPDPTAFFSSEALSSARYGRGSSNTGEGSLSSIDVDFPRCGSPGPALDSPSHMAAALALIQSGEEPIAAFAGRASAALSPKSGVLHASEPVVSGDSSRLATYNTSPTFTIADLPQARFFLSLCTSLTNLDDIFRAGHLALRNGPDGSRYRTSRSLLSGRRDARSSLRCTHVWDRCP